jgi:hypothetical protein
VTVEAIPRPQAVDGVVDIDFDSRTLAVRLPDAAGGHVRSLWRQAHLALLRDEQLGVSVPGRVGGACVPGADRVGAHRPATRHRPRPAG